ncbi:molybdate ABC transporter substrate-binding protein [Frigoribacterium salinisoli]
MRVPGRSRTRPPRLPRALLGLALVPALALVGCTGAGGAPGASGDPSADGATSPAGDLTGDVTVLAAASLTGTVAELVDAFEAEHPGASVTVSSGGSSALAQQVVAGAPADLFLSASTATMATVVDADLVDGAPVTFARNRLEIAVAPGDPEGVTGLADLARDDLAVALCAEQVPCGALARTVLDDAGVAVTPVTLEPDVTSTLTKVRLGEVDAALVYATDVRAAGDAVTGVPLGAEGTAMTDYEAALLADAPSPAAARAFLDLLLSDEGRQVLADAGFVVD